ncbi:MAG: PEP-CTERM sorting domain-containing protein [Bryobacteraceae bacterium]
MSAVPEPATFFLILPAFALALLLRKRIQIARREN